MQNVHGNRNPPGQAGWPLAGMPTGIKTEMLRTALRFVLLNFGPGENKFARVVYQKGRAPKAEIQPIYTESCSPTLPTQPSRLVFVSVVLDAV